MKGRKSLVTKYMWTNMGTLAVSFLILGIMILSFVINYWESEKSKIYFNDAEYISNIISNNSLVEKGNLVLVSSESVKMFMDTLSLDMGVDIFSTDKSGNVILFSSSQSEFLSSEFDGKIPKDVPEQVDYNKKMKLINFPKVYNLKRYVIREPIRVLIGGSEEIIGSVFMVIDPKPFDDFRSDMFKIFLFAFVLALFVSFVAVRKVSYGVVRPLKEISKAARCIENGDFSRRVKIKNEDEIGELSLAFNNMAKSLDASDSVRKSFIANVSHEFKTPMTTISGFITAILDGTISYETQEKYLKIILNEIKRLSGLVKMMLDLSRLDNEDIPLNYTNFSMNEVIFDILVSFENKINQKNLDIKAPFQDKDLYIYADKQMLYQAIYNLVENAIKFANESGYIKINYSKKGGEYELIIENSGPGIDKKEIGFIFDRFYKTDKSRSEDKTGFGLGLYIVKRIILLHGGTVKPESKLNHFTKFRIRIPQKAAPRKM